MKVNTSGTLTFNGTIVSLAGHSHSEYVAVVGDTMTGDLTLDHDGTGTVSSHGIVFISQTNSSNVTRKLNLDATGQFIFNSNAEIQGQLRVDSGTTNAIRLYTQNNTANIADTFADTTTDKSYIYFDQGDGSNDPGYIMHETSEATSPDERNEGVLHLVPSDDNSYGDYVSIHGTNDPDILKLHTDGTIEGVLNLTASGTVFASNVTSAGNLTIGPNGASSAPSHNLVFSHVSGTTPLTKNLNVTSGGLLQFNGNNLATESYVTSQSYITGISSSDVTTALGYTPVNPTNLATVATSGDYDDLTNKPSVNARFTVDLGSVVDRWYRVAKVNLGSGGLTLRGSLNNHVESFGTQSLDLTIFGRESNVATAITVDGRFEVAYQGVGVRILRANAGSPYAQYDVYIRVTQYTQADIEVIPYGVTQLTLGDAFTTTEPSGSYGVEFDNTSVGQGAYYVEASVIRTIWHSGNAADADTKVSKAGDTMTGNLIISKADPVIVLKDTSESNDTNHVSYLSFQDSANVEKAWLGFGSSGNTDFSISNNYNGDINLLGGKVGIGTSTPGQKLDVVGNIKASGELYSGSNKVWHAGNLEFELDGTTLNIITS